MYREVVGKEKKLMDNGKERKKDRRVCWVLSANNDEHSGEFWEMLNSIK